MKASASAIALVAMLGFANGAPTPNQAGTSSNEARDPQRLKLPAVGGAATTNPRLLPRDTERLRLPGLPGIAAE
ncbi:hypothetical protein AJ80_04822, partial [Polytolypa hystricis UAMH7299]